MTNTTVSLDEFNELIASVVASIATADFQPDTILALSTGGFPVAAALAKRLAINSRNVVGLPAYKDEIGDYQLDDRIVQLQNCAALRVLVVDDASNRGLLTRKAVQAVEMHGGTAKSCVLVAWKDGIQPDFVGRTCDGKPPKFFWEGAD